MRGRLGANWGAGRVVVFALILLPAAAVWGAESPGGVNGADTAWMLMASALVLAMTLPGLALFYGGLVRSKNVLGTIMQSFVILCLVSVLWLLVGYSLSFGPDKYGLVGGWEWFGLRDVGLVPHQHYAPTIPHQAFMIFVSAMISSLPISVTLIALTSPPSMRCIRLDFIPSSSGCTNKGSTRRS